MLSAMMKIAYRKRDEGIAAYAMPTRTLNTTWFSRHAAYWAQQSIRSKERWTRRARHAASAKRHALREEHDALEAELELIARDSADASEVVPISMSSASLEDKYLDALGALTRSDSFRHRANIEHARDSAARTPLPWSRTYIESRARHEHWY